MIRYVALATDYDGTIALDGRVDEATIEALARARESGRRLILVTGRELGDLQSVFNRLDLFEIVVAENGALIYKTATREEVLVGEPAPPAFIDGLRARGVTPLSVGRVIVATWHPNETAVLEVIREMGIERQIIFNKGAVMVLPAGVNKGVGLAAALTQMGISRHNVVGVGDAENDHAFLAMCEASVAVANALPVVKEQADFVSQRDHGGGVVELIDRMLTDDLASLEGKRHAIPLGVAAGRELAVPQRSSALIAGSSGSGKSTIARALLEGLMARGYQFCLVDPEGDYDIDGVVQVGDADHAPNEETALQLLGDPGQSAIVNLLGIPLADRPGYFARLLPRLQELRSRTGHPHWLIVDEAHHLLPREWQPAKGILPRSMAPLMVVTVHPEWMSSTLLDSVDLVVGVGPGAADAIAGFARAVGVAPPPVPAAEAEKPAPVAWFVGEADPVRFEQVEPVADAKRHRRKYAEGDVHEKAFYFRGPQGRLNLKAQNLLIFAQIAEGVDDETWEFHLRAGDYAEWFRAAIKDADLPAIAEDVAGTGLPAAESRRRILEAIAERYTAPA